jgi:hypothetical protein
MRNLALITICFLLSGCYWIPIPRHAEYNRGTSFLVRNAEGQPIEAAEVSLLSFDKHPVGSGYPRVRHAVRTAHDGTARIPGNSEWILTFPLVMHGEYFGYEAMWCVRKSGYETVLGAAHGEVVVQLLESSQSAACPEVRMAWYRRPVR